MRTAETHTQHILDKLGATSRAQVAAWFVTRRGAGAVPSAPQRRRLRRPGLVGAAAVLALLAVAAFAGLTQFRPPAPPDGAAEHRGALIYQARLDGEPGDFFGDYCADHRSADIRYSPGRVEYVVLAAGGACNNNVAVNPRARYVTEIVFSALPGSDVDFWFTVSNTDAHSAGAHLVELRPADDVARFAYFTAGQPQGLTDPVRVPGLRSGRKLTVTALVDPPRYTVWFDGKQAFDVKHEPSPAASGPAFGTSSLSGTGRVYLTAVKVYAVA